MARSRPPRPAGAAAATLTALLDTHLLLWIVLGSRRLAAFPWLDRYRPWTVSPVSLLEVAFLSEIGRFELKSPEFFDTVQDDSRFIMDEVPLVLLVRHAIREGWTRDPFDRLLAGHSAARRLPLVTADETILSNYPLVVRELRAAPEGARRSPRAHS